ncbi:MAG: TetR/AcrR family transcriptional regulator [Myxococcota bacterium]
MGRTPSITDEQILEAARQVFMEHGIRAPTALLAQRAGVSEGTLFNRFSSKEGLFAQAMTFDSMASLEEAMLSLDAAGTIEEALEGLVVRLVHKMRVVFPRMMLMWASVTPRAFFQSMESPPPLRLLSGLERWVRSRVEAGVLSAPDPQVFARMILGLCTHFVFLEATGLTEHPAHDQADLPLENYARDAVRTLLDGSRGVPA